MRKVKLLLVAVLLAAGGMFISPTPAQACSHDCNHLNRICQTWIGSHCTDIIASPVG